MPYFSSYVTTNRTQFYSELAKIAANLRTRLEYIECAMWLESKMNPQAVNKSSGATGLIQFMKTTAIGLGTSTAALFGMSNIQQLYYVQKYLQPYAGRMNTFADTYAAIFFPMMIGKADSWVLQTSSLTSEQIAKANKIFDLNKNNQITAGEFREAIYKLLPASVSSSLRNNNNMINNSIETITIAIPIISVFLISHFGTKYLKKYGAK